MTFKAPPQFYVVRPSNGKPVAGMPLFLQQSPTDSAPIALDNTSNEPQSELLDESGSFAADTNTSVQASNKSEVQVIKDATWTVQRKCPINVSNRGQDSSEEGQTSEAALKMIPYTTTV